MKTRFFAFAALALTLAACNNDNEILNNDGPVAARFTAAIGNNVTATPSTRVSGTDGDLWDNGDCIGITGAGYTNIPYVTSGDGNFTPKSVPIYYNDPSEHAFSAYYPYQEDSKLTEDKITVTTDAEAQQNQSSIDFLFASGATGSTYNPDVKFTDETKNGGPDNSFHHCMSRITFTFKGGSGVTIPAEGPLNYTLKELLLEGSFDTASGQAAATATDRESVTLPGRLTSAIFFPQDIATNIGMNIVLNGRTYSTFLPVRDDKLESGKEYHYNITISHNDATVSATITEWDRNDIDLPVQF